ncbi:MAG: restriction endonuclease [Phycisphaerae bacterium]
MAGKRIFISGAMLSHELDADRETARKAIDALSPEFTAFAYSPFREGSRPPLGGRAKERNRAEIAASDALVLLVGGTVSNYCVSELKFAYRLGLPCRVLARTGVDRKPKLRRFLASCPCPVVTYANPFADLALAVQKFCESLSSAHNDKRKVIAHQAKLWNTIVQELATDPERVFALSPRRFEELLAEIIASFGYATKLTPRTRDGGYDIIVQRKDRLFPSRYLIEAKLWTPPRSVGRPVIQGVYGAGMAENCNGVMVVTPAAFSRDALSFVDEKSLKEYIRLVDGVELPELYERYLRGADGNEEALEDL